MPTTYIIGHRKPDTDAVVAAMALESLFNQKSCFGYQQSQAVVIDPPNPETSYLLDRFQVTAPPQLAAGQIQVGDQVVLVDHNEESQRLVNLPANQIVEIIDHHKVNLNLNQPIFITFKPWGSTATIIYYLMKTNHVQPDKKLASLMLAAILSDTVGFKSATTTNQDKEFGTELAKLAAIDDLDGFAFDIFKAKSDISSLSDEQIVQNDYKIFEFGQKTFINQLETVEQTKLLATKKDQLLAALQRVKQDQQVELAFMAITDVLQINTKLLVAGKAEAAVAEKAFGGQVKDSILDIGPKLSRKKEIAPAIERAVG